MGFALSGLGLLMLFITLKIFELVRRATLPKPVKRCQSGDCRERGVQLGMGFP